jgi:hypothetical protein
VVTNLLSGTHSKSIVVDQSVPLPDRKAFHPIDTVALEAIVDTVVEIAYGNAARFVILDALQRLSIETETSP